MAPPNGGSLFTPSGPYASSKDAPRTSTVRIAGPAPPGETPQEKVARLRAAANRAKQAQLDPWDRVVETGRKWADRTHRTVTYGLIGFTAVATVVVSVSIANMLIHNRQQRDIWYQEQQKNLQKALAEARQAQASGLASEHQLDLLREDAEVQAEREAKANAKGIFTRAKESVFGGLSDEEKPGGRLGAVSERAAKASEEARVKATQAARDLEQRGEGVVKAVEQRTQTMVKSAEQKGQSVVHAVGELVGSERNTQKLEAVTKGSQDVIARTTGGGPLDSYADNIAKAAQSSTQSWWSWATGR